MTSYQNLPRMSLSANIKNHAKNKAILAHQQLKTQIETLWWKRRFSAVLIELETLSNLYRSFDNFDDIPEKEYIIL